LKRIFLLFIFILSAIIAKAQSDYNFMPRGIGFDISTIRGFTNVAKQNNTLAFSGYYVYYPSPYFPVTFELQGGRLWGGSRVTDEYSREYENNYFAALIHADLQMGQVVDYDGNDFMTAIKDLYFGIGGGFVKNNVQNQRYDLFDQGYAAGTYKFPGTDKSIEPDINFRLGYEFKFFNEFNEPYLRLHIEYVHHVVFGEGLDGYDDPVNKFKNNFPDQYRQITIGLIYNFGTIRSFTKRIRNDY
jgi:hypothetical protein